MWGPSDKEMRQLLLVYAGIALGLLALAFGVGVAVGHYVWR